VGGQRVDTEQANGELPVLALAGDLLGLLGEQDLVVGVERLRDVDLVQHRLDERFEVALVGGVARLVLADDAVELHRIREDLVVEAADHLVDTLRAEGVLGVDEDGRALQTAVFGGKLNGDGELR